MDKRERHSEEMAKPEDEIAELVERYRDLMQIVENANTLAKESRSQSRQSMKISIAALVVLILVLLIRISLGV